MLAGIAIAAVLTGSSWLAAVGALFFLFVLLLAVGPPRGVERLGGDSSFRIHAHPEATGSRDETERSR